MPSSQTSVRPCCVATIADEHYVPFLACLLLSLADHSLRTEPVEVIVIYRGIDNSIRQQLEALLPEPHCVRWCEVTQLSQLCNPQDVAGLPPTYWSLLAPYAVAGTSRVLYMDCDVIVTGPVGRLYHHRLDGRTVAAAQDCLPTVAEAIENWRGLGFDPSAPYFNAGVMLIDVEKWKEMNVSRRAIEMCRANAQHLIAQHKWPQHEQYGLNVVLRDDWTRLPACWNHWSFAPGTDACIVHYLGDGKPTKAECLTVFRELFVRTLARTPFALGQTGV
jgi:lipopolysaccharide biosynthesis glycosyltransferase